jgi:undecaprenyl diphosphate synthase
MSTATATPPRAPVAAGSPPRRLPRHVGLIPDGNRRWAEARGGAREEGYAAGLAPGFRLLQLGRALGIEEFSVYGYTKENVRRPTPQVQAFRAACVDFVERAVAEGAGVAVIGDAESSAFPRALEPLTRARSPGTPRVNVLVNYGWQWDLAQAVAAPSRGPLMARLASCAASRVDLVVRWGGRRRLSGFLPVQCAYADFYVIDTLWPDMRPEEFIAALHWYAAQDVTLGG